MITHQLLGDLRRLHLWSRRRCYLINKGGGGWQLRKKKPVIDSSLSAAFTAALCVEWCWMGGLTERLSSITHSFVFSIFDNVFCFQVVEQISCITSLCNHCRPAYFAYCVFLLTIQHLKSKPWPYYDIMTWCNRPVQSSLSLAKFISHTVNPAHP